MTPEELLNQLTSEVPLLRETFDHHVSYYDGVLPHVLMADFTRVLLSQYRDVAGRETSESIYLQQVLDLLGKAYESGDPGARDLILTSFLENLEADDPDAVGLRSMFGPALRRAEELSDS